MAIFGKLRLGMLLLAACATGNEGLDGADGGTRDAPFVLPDGAGFLDARPIVDAPRAPDSGTQNDFNQPCGDRTDCKTGLCLLSGIGGYCTMLCHGGDCPAGFGCLGVQGIAEPGQATFVCVRDANLLCSPCTSSSECATSANDLCLPAATGGSFCGRDCSAISCPSGYACQQVPAGDAGTAKQCVPQSGACDCNATLMGTTKACTLTTPLGTTCAAVRTCLGSAGWGDCLPPAATDVPDGNFTDENCDGIDGTVSDGVFVATAAHGGEDNPDCGPVTNPCLTISNGGRRAALTGKHYVYVQAGTYTEVVIMRDGVSIFGGYDTMWQRADRAAVGHEVRIQGALYDTDSQYVAVIAHDLSTPTTIADVTIIGGNAVGSSSRSGRSSYGIHVASSHLTVARVSVTAGQGAPGARGADGMDAPQVDAIAPGMSGKAGGDGKESASFCDDTDFGAGGDPGVNACDNYALGSPVAGKGGDGGTKDDDCPFGFSATDGHDGSPAAQELDAVYGFGGFKGLAHHPNGDDWCSAPGPGGNGRFVNGPGGPGGVGGGHLVGSYWFAWPGSDGQVGMHGGGGGGGGGESGCDIGTDSYGPGGGGGGAGGCAARTGGQGGEGGGGSFGVFVTGSTVTLRNVDITQSNGAAGGDGGNGGRGQTGGDPGPGGHNSGDDNAGGAGGGGGHGGHGGGGGGGAGGVSYGLFTSQSTVDRDATVTIHDTSASPGDGGNPGVSAPNAPLPIRDGNPGTGGARGSEGQVFDCVSAGQC